jgi:SAM-dependent methyltransferase
MFALDPAHAVAEIRRVLRPGGWVALAVWGPRDRNPWLSLVFDAVSAQLGAPVPPPGVPGPFALDDPRRLARLLTGADLTDVAVTELPVPLRDTSFDTWLTRTSSLAGPLAKRLAALPDTARRQLRDRLETAVRPYQTPAGLEFPASTSPAPGATTVTDHARAVAEGLPEPLHRSGSGCHGGCRRLPRRLLVRRRRDAR